MNQLLQSGAVTQVQGAPNVAYLLEDKSIFALTQYKVLQSRENNGFIKCVKDLYNGKIKLLYFTSNQKSLLKLLPSLDCDAFLKVVSGLLSAVIEIKSNGFLICENLDLSFDKIYVDTNTLSVQLIYLPVNGADTDLSVFENELRTDLVRLITGTPALAGEKMSWLCSCLSNGTLSVEELYKTICAACSNGEAPAEAAGAHADVPVQPHLKIYSINAPLQVRFDIGQSEFVLGKNAAAVDGAITFNKAISRVHCKIIFQDGGYSIVDLGSANGTYVNQNRIAPNQPHLLENGDTLRLANSDFMVQITGV